MKKISILLVLLLFLLVGCKRDFRVTFLIYNDNSTSQIIKKGDKINNFTPTMEGYTFVCWLYNDNVYDVDSEVLENFSLTAEWIKNDYQVTFKIDEETTRSYTYEYKDKVKKIEDPVKEDYIFLGWYNNNSLYDFNNPVKSNLELEARFVKDDEYKPLITISFNSTGANIKYESIKINRLSKLENLPTPTYEGYTFLGWYFNNKEFKEEDVLYEINDFTLIAKWK